MVFITFFSPRAGSYFSASLVTAGLAIFIALPMLIQAVKNRTGNRVVPATNRNWDLILSGD